MVYLPDGIKPDEPAYYSSSRFDWSSNIGAISRQGGDGETHVLFGTHLWRQPHDRAGTEGGVGLASEFGVGDDGSFCNFQCGWNKENDVTNGVLGYDSAGVGESFLKIGVGALIKGSCPECDPTGVYKFNSPYQFASPPVWQLKEGGDGRSLKLSNEETLHEFGYMLQKDISLNDHQLLITTTLTNIGRVAMSTAWYSHNFFTCDNTPVGRGYSVNLDLPGGGAFMEPGFMLWSSPMGDYAQIGSSDKRKVDVLVEMQRRVERSVKLKAEFMKDEMSRGGFTLHGCHTAVRESIPQVGKTGGPSLYAFNLYIEEGTFSPEVQLFLHLHPGESTSWTQQLDFTDEVPTSSSSLLGSITGGTLPTVSLPPLHSPVLAIVGAAVLMGGLVWQRHRSRNLSRRSFYQPI